jgi:hypothetical protein
MLGHKREARRWVVVAYWTFVLSLIATLAVASGRESGSIVDRPFFWFWWTLLVFPLFLRSIVTFSTRGTNLQTLIRPVEGGRGFEPRPLDERELGLHLRMHTKAYYFLQIFVPAGVLLLTPPEIYQNAWLVSVRIPMLWLLCFVVTSLPQTLILWCEPDMEEAP